MILTGNEGAGKYEGVWIVTMTNAARRRLGVIPSLGVLLVALAPWAHALPRGRELLENGDFTQDPARPLHWVTRAPSNVGKFALKPPEGDAKTPSLQVDVSQPSPRPWTIELRQAPDTRVRAGETLYITFEYKMTPGFAFNCYWQQDSAPWDKFLSARVTEPAGEWHKCAMALRNHAPLAAKEGSLTFHLAEKAGSIAFRNISIRAFDSRIAVETLPTTVDPVLGGDFHDSTWRDRAVKRLLKIRTGELTVRVRKGEEPVAQAAVTIKQQTRPFLFGIEAPAPLLESTLLAGEEFRDLKKRLGERDAELAKYRSKVLDSRLFSAISLREALVWRVNSMWGKAAAESLLPALVDRGFLVRGHALYCPAFRFAPPACRQMPADQLAEALRGYTQATVQGLLGRVAQWDVVHAPLTYEEIYDVVGEASMVDAFRLAEKHDPGAVLALSDDKSLTVVSTEHMTDFVALAGWLREQGARLDIVALEARMRRPYLAPQELERRLDRISAQMGLPIVITSFSIEAPSESIQAERLRDLLILFFSHPAVTGVYLEGIWEPLMGLRKAALYREHNFAIKPAGKTLEKLLLEDWHTDVTAKTAADGSVTTQAFLGQYEILVDHDGERVKQKIILDDSQRAEVTVQLPE